VPLLPHNPLRTESFIPQLRNTSGFIPTYEKELHIQSIIHIKILAVPKFKGMIKVLLAMSPRRGSASRHINWLTVNCTMNLTCYESLGLTLTSHQLHREAFSPAILLPATLSAYSDSSHSAVARTSQPDQPVSVNLLAATPSAGFESTHPAWTNQMWHELLLHSSGIPCLRGPHQHISVRHTELYGCLFEYHNWQFLPIILTR
jgi:hypothetical protein